MTRLYDYTCPECSLRFEFPVSNIDDSVECPDDGTVAKRIPSFAGLVGRARAPLAPRRQRSGSAGIRVNPGQGGRIEVVGSVIEGFDGGVVLERGSTTDVRIDQATFMGDVAIDDRGSKGPLSVERSSHLVDRPK